MKDLIIKPLEDFLEKLTKGVPKTCKTNKYVDISEVLPKDLSKFMLENNIPDEADFDGEPNGYDGWTPWVIRLRWEIDVPTNEEQKQEYIETRFENENFRIVANVLKPNGYKILKWDWQLLGHGKLVYSWLINKEYEKIVNYFSQRFAKVD